MLISQSLRRMEITSRSSHRLRILGFRLCDHIARRDDLGTWFYFVKVSEGFTQVILALILLLGIRLQ